MAVHLLITLLTAGNKDKIIDGMLKLGYGVNYAEPERPLLLNSGSPFPVLGLKVECNLGPLALINSVKDLLKRIDVKMFSMVAAEGSMISWCQSNIVMSDIKKSKPKQIPSYLKLVGPFTKPQENSNDELPKE